MKENPLFTKWSDQWKAERSKCDPHHIVKLWQDAMPQRWKRDIWEGELGYRKRSDNKGEQRIEKELFAAKGGFVLNASSEVPKPFRCVAIYHNMPLANQRRGQVIADAFGILEIGKVKRPLLIEVKVTDHNLWYSLVECLQQVRLARACAKNITAFTKKMTASHELASGIWGMVLAPASYYEKHEKRMKDCENLLCILKEQTCARIAFAVWPSKADDHIEIRHSNWSF